MPDEENVELYKDAVKQGDDGWGPEGRMTTYAGTSVGLIKHVAPAEEIVKEVAKEASEILAKTAQRFR